MSTYPVRDNSLKEPKRKKKSKNKNIFYLLLY